MEKLNDIPLRIIFPHVL